MNRVVEILMKRDGLTEKQAERMVNDCKELLITCNMFQVEEIMREELGLEPDYLDDILLS